MDAKTNEPRVVVIQGSSRKSGDVGVLTEMMLKHAAWDVIDLNEYQYSYFDYEHKNKGDDFLPLMGKLIQNYDVFLFATPVYWYTMSGVMKVFFDRISDLLTIEKDLGRALRGKSMAALCCSHAPELDDAFWYPFRGTADYLGMHYLGNLHAVAGSFEEEPVKNFVEKIRAGAD